MPFSGGIFSKIYAWATEQLSPPIEISKLDDQESDFATGLSNCILRDGTGVPTAATPWNSQRITGLGAGTARTDAARVDQVQDSSQLALGAVAGTDTITGSLTPAITAYTAARAVIFEPAATNTGAVTININGLGARAIVKGNGVALAAGDLVTGVPVLIIDDGTRFVLINPQTGVAGTGLFADGTAGAPSVSFASGPNTGMYRVGSNSLGFAYAGTQVLRLDQGDVAAHFAIKLLVPDGTVGAPVYSFEGDTDSGLFRAGPNEFRAVAAGAVAAVFFDNAGQPQFMVGQDGTAAKPGLTWLNDSNSGLYKGGNDDIRLSIGGALRMIFQAGFTEMAAGVTFNIADGAVGTPSLAIATDLNTGLYAVSADNLGVSAGGVRVIQFRNVAGAVKLLGADGTAADPYYSFDLDPDTGHIRVSSGRVAFISNGTEIFGYDSLANGGLYRREALGNPFPVGYLEIPQNIQASNYTLVLADSGKHIYHASGAGAGDTYTIPANASVAYAIGTALTFVNNDSNSISIAITTDTMTLAGTTTTGTRTLAQNGIATAIKTTATTWLISGTGLS